MKEFIIDEMYEQICINFGGSIEISGLLSWDAIKINRDAESANIRSKVDGDCVTIQVGANCAILKDGKLTVLLNPEDYPVEAIVINIKKEV